MAIGDFVYEDPLAEAEYWLDTIRLRRGLFALEDIPHGQVCVCVCVRARARARSLPFSCGTDSRFHMVCVCVCLSVPVCLRVFLCVFL